MTQSNSQPAGDGIMPSDDWAGAMGQRWLANLSSFEAMIAPIGDALLAHAACRPGERVIDLGCGGGATSIALARAVAPDGAVLGLDISPDLIRAAQARADQANLANLCFACADAATAVLDGAPYDRLVSRFGSMFFAEPVPAFTHLRTQLRPGGRVNLAVWGPPRDNGWMMGVMGVARAHVDLPPAVPRAPGPFAFEDADYLSEVLTGAGFHDMRFTDWRAPLAIGGPGATPQSAADFAFAALAIGPALAAVEPAVQAAARADLEALFAQHHDGDAGVLLPARVWLVSATA